MSIEQRVARLTIEGQRLEGISRETGGPDVRAGGDGPGGAATPRRPPNAGSTSPDRPGGRPTPTITGGRPGPRPWPRPSTTPGPGPAPSGWSRWRVSWAPCSSWSRSTTASRRPSRRPRATSWPRSSSTASTRPAGGLAELQRGGSRRRGRGPAGAWVGRAGPGPASSGAAGRARHGRGPAAGCATGCGHDFRASSAWLDRLLAGVGGGRGGWTDSGRPGHRPSGPGRRHPGR